MIMVGIILISLIGDGVNYTLNLKRIFTLHEHASAAIICYKKKKTWYNTIMQIYEFTVNLSMAFT